MTANSIPAKYQNLRAVGFGDGPAMADELLGLVLKHHEVGGIATVQLMSSDGITS